MNLAIALDERDVRASASYAIDFSEKLAKQILPYGAGGIDSNNQAVEAFDLRSRLTGEAGALAQSRRANHRPRSTSGKKPQQSFP